MASNQRKRSIISVRPRRDQNHRIMPTSPLYAAEQMRPVALTRDESCQPHRITMVPHTKTRLNVSTISICRKLPIFLSI